ncbi:uncharacterized protein LOC116422381 isoform X1 [Sarcophilus harrisii]|uniref:uncharacterized protein LOC116422381 isoform X1 n=1 Tax=Sarcophilus harrisii TaxID=9305 RepID=UPI001301C60D|nr:uncharacterized protein LOC116422381 isoform X1 [Sarcophilus harrisii]XP_031815601.1 uncharacterized protein LOC116422381 isoform X1 [Sarcophilus harrisii]XP_031815602.1 uncharacterized protein LOC116422381 isoform X1 [Sarcophilus harrisii]
MGKNQKIFSKEAPRPGLCYKAKVVWLPCPPHHVSPLLEQDSYVKAEQASLKHQERTIQPVPHPRPRTEPVPSPHFKHPMIAVRPPCPPPSTVTIPLPHLHHQSTVNKAPASPKHQVVTSALPVSRPDVPSAKPAVTLAFSKQCPPLRPIHQPVIPLDANQHTEAAPNPDHFPKIIPSSVPLAEDPSHLKHLSALPSSAEVPPREVHRTMFIAVPQAGPNHPIRVTSVPVNPGPQPLPKPRRRIRATNALLGFLKLEPMLHSASSISLGPNHWSRETTAKPSGLDNWTQPKRSSSSHPNLLCPWKTVSLLYCNESPQKSMGEPLSHLNQKTRATTAPAPVQLQQAGDMAGPMAHGLLQMEKKPWETSSVRASQDPGLRQLPIDLHFQGKTLHVPNHQVVPPPHPVGPLQPMAQVPLQMEQDHRKTMPLRPDNQVPNPTGQDHWTIPPFLGMDGQKTILFLPQYQATPPPSPIHQSEDIPGSIAYTLKTLPPRMQPQATTITGASQNLRTVPSMVSYKHDINQLGAVPQFTTSLNPDYQVGKVINPNAQLIYQPNVEVWGTMTKGMYHQDMSPFVWGYGAIPQPQNTNKTIPPHLDHWGTPLQPEFQTKTIPDPNVRFTLQSEPKHHGRRQLGVDHQPAFLACRNQGPIMYPPGVGGWEKIPPGPNYQETVVSAHPGPKQQPAMAIPDPAAQILFQPEQGHRGPTMPKIKIQTPDLNLVSSLGLDTQNPNLCVSEHQARLVVNNPHQPKEMMKDAKVQVSFQEFKRCEIPPVGTHQQTPNPPDHVHGTTVPLNNDEKVACFPASDHCILSPPGPAYQAEAVPEPNDQDAWQQKLEHNETIQSAMEQEAKNSTGKDHGATLAPLNKDQQETNCELDHQDTSRLKSDCQTEDTQDPRDQDSIQPEQHWQKEQPGTDQQITNPPAQDSTEKTLIRSTENQETILSGTGHPSPDFRAIDSASPGTRESGKTEQENKERPPLGRECKATTLLTPDLEATVPPLGSDAQDKTLLDPENHGSLAPRAEPDVDASGPVASEQVLRETLKTDPQATGTTICDHQITPPIVGADCQAPCPPTTGAHNPIQKELEEWERSEEISSQDSILLEVGVMHIPKLDLDLQDTTPCPPVYGPDDQATDRIDPIAPTWVQTEQKSREVSSIAIDQQATTVTGQTQEAVTCPPDLESQDTAQCGPKCQSPLPCSLDKREKNIASPNDLFSLQPPTNQCTVVSQETDQQTTILMDLGFRTSPPLLIHPQDPILLDSTYQTTPSSGPAEAFSDPDLQNIPPPDPECLAQWSPRQERQVSPLSSVDHQVTLLPNSTNQAEAIFESVKPQVTMSTQLCNQDKALISFIKPKTVLPSGPGLLTKRLRGRGPQVEKFDPQVQIHSRPQYQTQPVLNKKSSCLYYIKPYTVEGGIIPNRIVQLIIDSIPQEKIKNDVYKQILLRKRRKFSPHGSNGYSSSYYPICLLCASWIPNGCPHEGMKYPFEAQLLAIPTPMPGFEELGVRFVLQVPQTTESSPLEFPYSRHGLQRHPHGPQIFSTSSYSDPGLSRSSRPKWLHFILDKAHQQEGRNQEAEFIGEMPLKRHSLREEDTGDGRTFFKSLLERFQWRLRD